MNENLEKSFKKICRHDNQGSLQTRKTYRQCQREFLEHVSKEFNLQSLKRLKNKHVISYINTKLDQGESKIYMQKIMVAIRRLNANCNGLVDISNKELGIDGKGKLIAIPGLSDTEYQRTTQIATTMDDDGFIYYSAKMGNEFGLRSNEIVNLRFKEVRDCLDTGILKITHGTKGGRPREITYHNKDFLNKLLQTNFCEGKCNDDKILCSREKGSVRKRLSQLHNFFTKNSNLIIDKTREQKSVGAHSLRRRFAQIVMIYTYLKAVPTKKQ